ncbi:hypothetical protein CKO15_06050 [Halorhodospira abdelmalekii]|uniref:hypothetical protein n=1 Tax=Halorhodospira abdelmalekii TaxID=421629 RepID=UPI00190461C9|nr:hypothetical protein [Halorhodospira abdelmalekii]MBK1734858.1 hypothetical protein [Halorhodospira abdelmalekii]
MDRTQGVLIAGGVAVYDSAVWLQSSAGLADVTAIFVAAVLSVFRQATARNPSLGAGDNGLVRVA